MATNSFKKIIPMLVVLVLVSITTYSQSITGSISGFVVDQNYALIRGANIKVLHKESGAFRNGKTNDSGYFSFMLLRPGTYTLTFELAHFKTLIKEGINLHVNQALRFDTVMEVGNITITVTSVERESIAKTESAETSDLIQNKRIVDLPLNGRKFSQLALSTPGVVENARGSFAYQLSSDIGPRLSVMGARESDNYYTLDSTSLTDRFYNTLSIPVSIDAIQEFKVQAKLYSSESGILGGAQINIAIKSGTNDLHGSLFGFLRNDNLDARNFFDTNIKPEFRQNQFGATIGGPVVTNKAFYFGNYEGLRLSKARTHRFTVPSDKMRQGIFSSLIKDPITGLPFQNNTIPDDRISPVAKAYLEYIPKANLGGVSNNFVATTSEINDSNQFTIKTDLGNNTNNDIHARYTFYDADAFQPYGYGAYPSSVSSLPGFGVFIKQRSQNLSLANIHVYSSKLVSEARLGFNRTAGGQLQENHTVDFARQNSIAGSSRNLKDLGLPRITGATLSAFGDASTPISRRNNDIQADYNLSWFQGNHSLKFGGHYKRIQFNPYIPSTKRGLFVFDGSYTGISGSTSQPFADFLLGLPSQARSGSGDPTVYMRGNEWAVYLQDDFKLFKKLTINLGLRYDYLSPFSEKYNKWATLDVANRRIIVASENGQTYPHKFWTQGVEKSILPVTIITSEQAGIDRSLARKDKNNFAPRFGFTFDVFGTQKTILRGGYGIFYNTASFNAVSLQSLAVPFFAGTLAINSKTAPVKIESILGSALAIPRFDPYDLNFRTPYYQQWSLGIQQLLTQDLSIEAQYLGSRGVKLYSQISYAAPPFASSTPSPTARSPIPGLGLFSLGANSGDSNYHAGVLRVEKRLSHGLMMMGSYTYSKSIDNDSLANSVISSNLDQGIYKNIERGLSSFDVRQRVIVTLTYDIPFNSTNKLLNRIFGKWQVGGIITEQSGQPFTINIVNDRANSGTQNQRPDVIKNPNLPSDQRTPERWFDTSAFVMQPVGSYGNAARNIVEGPGTNLVDLSLLKNIPVSDRQKLQLRAEFFNLFNHTNFDVPNRFCNSPATAQAGTACTMAGFGRVSAARDPRIIQFGLKYAF